MAGFTVAGRQFRTESEYKQGLHDQKIIDSIKDKYDLSNPGDVIRLSNELTNGKYNFLTMVGNDFDDEIFDLAREFKEQGFSENSSLADVKTKKNKNSKDKKSKDKKTVQRKNVSLNDFDESMQTEIRSVMKNNEIKRKVIIVTFALLAAGCLSYFFIYSYMADKADKGYEELAELKGATNLNPVEKPEVTINYSEDETVSLPILDEYVSLYNKNKKLIGWLKIADTNIDYPVMQTVNNEYYLDHNFDQESDKNGALFLDKDCDVVKRSTNLIIYGHHMKSGKMFGNLVKYESEKYYEKHPIIEFDTIYEKGYYQVMYVFRSHVYSEDEVVFKYYQFIDAVSEKEFNSNMLEMEELSMYDTGVKASYGDDLLTLSTCDYNETDGRFVVVAKRIENSEVE